MPRFGPRFRDDLVDIGACRIRARSAGPTERPDDPSSADVVLVHGLAGSSGAMIRVGRLLARRHRVHAVDLPGHGRSGTGGLTVPDLAHALAGWCDARGLRGTAVVAASFGCQVAVETAVERPDLVARLVLLGPLLDPAARTRLGFALGLLVDMTREPRIVPNVARGALQVGPRRLLTTIGSMGDHPVEDQLTAVRVPTLVLRGARDPLVSADDVERAVSLLPNGRALELATAAHAANLSAPGRVVAAVEPFLAA